MIEYDESSFIALIFKWHGSVFGMAAIYALPSAVLGFGLRILADQDEDIFARTGLLEGFDKSQAWSVGTFVLVILLSMRTNRAIARFWEGTGLLHQMRGEWFDSVSCLFAFSVSAKASKPSEVFEFRHTVVRLMSLCHASGLEEISAESTEPLVTIDTFGLNELVIEHLHRSKMKYGFNRVEVILHMLQTLITKALDDGVLQIAPPILSRVYQTLSRGLVNLLNARKIVDTRFPFPYVQIINLLQMVFGFVTPLMISSFVANKYWCALFSFLPVFGTFCLLFVAVELENPFGDDVNDLPMHFFQEEMNKCLLMLLEDNVDIIPTLSKCAVKDFHELLQSVEQGSALSRANFGSWIGARGRTSGSANLGLDKFDTLPRVRQHVGRTSGSASLGIEKLDSWSKRVQQRSSLASSDTERKLDPQRDPEASQTSILSLGRASIPVYTSGSSTVTPIPKVLPQTGNTSGYDNMLRHAIEQIDLMESHLRKLACVSDVNSIMLHPKDDSIAESSKIPLLKTSTPGVCCGIYSRTEPDLLAPPSGNQVSESTVATRMPRTPLSNPTPDVLQGSFQRQF